jgi:hypothetical protein
MPLFHISLSLPARPWARFVVLHTSSFMRIYLMVKIVWLFPPNYSVILFVLLGLLFMMYDDHGSTSDYSPYSIGRENVDF